MKNKFSIIIFLLLILTGFLFAQEDEVCLDCHADPTLTTTRDGKVLQMYIKKGDYVKSTHGEVGCVSCHDDVNPEDLPHAEKLKKVECQNCHEDEYDSYHASLHGDAYNRGDPYAPTCVHCHGSHYVLPPTNPESPTYVMNIPLMCGRCHKEDTDMVKRHNIPEKDIIQNYSMSIHGEGLFNRGLIVTAVCTNCHTPHKILPHTDPNSSIHRNNIAKTCMQCHAQIEQVHLKVIRGELWEKQPHSIPACIECHSPHKIRRVFYADTMNDGYCMDCHSRPGLVKKSNGEVDSLFVELHEIRDSAHGNNIECIECHVNMSNQNNPVCKDSGPVDCSICHAEVVANYQISSHGKAMEAGDENAPGCSECHGTHFIQPPEDLTSPIFPKNVPQLCGKCHRSGETVAQRIDNQTEIVDHYTMSIHGKGLLESGLMVTAVCNNCHNAHLELPASDENSWVHPDNIGQTCGQCHLGIYEDFKTSIHHPDVADTDEKLPTCHDCHNAHEVERIDNESFRQQILNECGTCHEEETGSYFETYHGKVSLLGSGKTAKCSDCHGAHNILPAGEPKSTLSHGNVVETCRQCHPNSNRKFTGYLSHATHHDRAKFPILYYTFWAMTILLIGTFAFFGLHTILWVPRSLWQRLKVHKKLVDDSKSYFVRFESHWRVLHVIVIISFMGLAISGMVLKFAGTAWASFIANNILGGFEMAGLIHRLCALLTLGYFLAHFVFMFKKWKKSGKTLRAFLFDKEGLIPTWNDLKEFFQTIRWFFGHKKQPNYGKWTYWEKFDYFAVFWGVTMIGFSGLTLWFPEFFTLFLPGWFLNVATIIHSDEALLATGFIFTVHFFNTHFRPEKFPMDPVIFTGKVPLEVFKHERPREYALLKKEGKLEEKLKKAPSKSSLLWARIFGIFFLLL
ncbi:hypothetical protein B6I21_07660, partial [candidate division KSB1 bacterium 4572_119]